MRRFLLYLGFLTLLVSVASAQSTTPVVEGRMLLATDGAYAGSTVSAAVEAQIATGYHINDHHPSLEYLIPTEFKLETAKEASLEKVDYPKGKPQKFAFADEPLSVYEGSLVVGAKLKVAPGVAPGTYTLKGKLAYQACNDHACLPPASVPLTLSLKVVDRNVPLKRVNANVFSKISRN